MNKVFQLVFYFILTIFSFSSWSKNSITWYETNTPPVFILEGPFKGQGYIQLILEQIIEGLTDYEHIFETATAARILYNLKQEEKSCYPTLIKTKQREEFIAFSKPVELTPTLRLITRKGFIPDINQNESIDLLALINKNYSILLIKERSYGLFIDDILSQLETGNIQRIVTAGNQTILKMLLKKRTDMALAYPFEVNFFVNDLQMFEQLDLYSIKGLPQYQLGHVGCPKNAWGNKIIKQVDERIDEIKDTPEYIKAMTKWWPHEAERMKSMGYLN